MNLPGAVFSVLVCGLSVAALLFAARRVGRRQKKISRRIAELQELWAWSPPEARVEAFDRRLCELDDSPAADRPGSEATRAETAFYAGCAYLAEGNLAGAARMFQVAYHADPSLPTALVLAFACLKANAGRGNDLPGKCAETWQELGSPSLGQSHRERLLLRKGGGAYEVLAPLIGLPRGKATIRASSKSAGCAIKQ